MSNHWLVKEKNGHKITLRSGYIVDERFSWAWLVFTFIFIFGVFWSQDFNFKEQVYVHCEGPTQCFNPLYERCDDPVCDMEYIPAGFTQGEPMPLIVENAAFIVIGVGLLLFGINHLLFNKDFDGLEVE